MPENSIPVNLNSSKQALFDEVEALREQLAANQAARLFARGLNETLSKVLRVGYWTWNEITGRPISFTEDMATILGLSLESLYAQYRCEEDYIKFVHADDVVHYFKNVEIVSAPDFPRGEAHVFYYRVVRPDGAIRHVRDLEYGKLEENGQIIRTYGALQDITDQVESTLAQKKSEQRYMSLFDEIPLGVQEQDWSAIKRKVDQLQATGITDLMAYFELNPDLLLEMVDSITITQVNDKMLEIYGADSAEEYIDDEEDAESWMDEAWINLYSSEIAALASGEGVKYSELSDVQMDYTEFEVRMITNVVKGDEKTWSRVLTIVEDISERKQYETDLIKAKTEAEKASRAKTEFLSNMSHELRTPLNAILGFSQLFETDTSLSAQRHSNARSIHEAGQHLLNLINDVLDVSRIESGNTELSMESVDLGVVIDGAVAWVKKMAEDRDVTIDVNLSGHHGIIIEADAVRLKQVMLNLLSNAVKYNREAGRIKIELTTDDQGWVDIAITDTGLGIAREKLEDLFKPFNRLGAELSAVEGTGIGLVITRQLVKLMSGEIKVASRFNEGSTFTLRFKILEVNHPIDELHATMALSPDSEMPIQRLVDELTGKPHILVAEDNIINQEVFGAQLDFLGYDADFAINGVEALNMWKTGAYQLLITDIRMPEMDGYELIRQIRTQEVKTGGRCPIIASSANAMESDTQRCLEVGADDVISKPVSLESLKQVLDAYTGNA